MISIVSFCFLMWLLESLKLHAWFTFVVCSLVLSQHWSRPSVCLLLLLSYLQSMRRLVAVNQGVRYFWPCRTFEAGLQSVWGLVCLQLTFTPRVQSFSISTQRAGSLPGSLPWTSIRVCSIVQSLHKPPRQKCCF